MKVIVTGSTGLVGSAVVRECIANDKITHAFVLSRKELPKDITENPKISVIIHEDFSTYPEHLLKQLEGAEACIWAIGGRAPQFSDIETYKKVQVDYTLAAATAFREHLAPLLPEGKKFHFVFCSGKLAEWDQQKSLRFMADTRHVKGQVEKGLCDLAKGLEHRFDTWCARPSLILPADAGVFSRVSGKLASAILASDLARALVKIALDGHKSQIVESHELSKL